MSSCPISTMYSTLEFSPHWGKHVFFSKSEIAIRCRILSATKLWFHLNFFFANANPIPFFLSRMIELHNMGQLEGTWINYPDSVLKKYSTVLTINCNVAQISNLRWEFFVKSILDKLKDCLWSKNFHWVKNHEKYSVYLNIIPNKYCAASHLKLYISLVKKRLISQCRLNSSFVRINSLNVIM